MPFSPGPSMKKSPTLPTSAPGISLRSAWISWGSRGSCFMVGERPTELVFCSLSGYFLLRHPRAADNAFSTISIFPAPLVDPEHSRSTKGVEDITLTLFFEELHHG